MLLFSAFLLRSDIRSKSLEYVTVGQVIQMRSGISDSDVIWLWWFCPEEQQSNRIYSTLESNQFYSWFFFLTSRVYQRKLTWSPAFICHVVQIYRKERLGCQFFSEEARFESMGGFGGSYEQKVWVRVVRSCTPERSVRGCPGKLAIWHGAYSIQFAKGLLTFPELLHTV